VNITIIIPTKNRTKFIDRQLQYFAKSNYQGFLFFGDASDDDIFDRNVKLIKRFDKKLKITHYHDKESSADQTIHNLMKHVKTDFVTSLPDDDQILTPSINKCIEFLNANTEYSAAHGKTFEMSVNFGKDDAFGRVTKVAASSMYISEEGTSIERIEGYILKPSNINMSIVRVNHSIKAYEACKNLDYYYSSLIFGELTVGCVLLSIGKIKELDETYLIRQLHNSQYFDSMNLVEWFSRAEWSHSFLIFKRALYDNFLIPGSDSFDRDQKKIDSIVSQKMKGLLLSICKANLIYKIKSISILSNLFVYYRYFKNITKRNSSIDQLNDLNDYLNIITLAKSSQTDA